MLKCKMLKCKKDYKSILFFHIIKYSMKKYNSNNIKNIILIALICLSIYFLYFYDSDLNIESHIKRKDNYENIENFDTKYKNLCKDRPTHFYNIDQSKMGVNMGEVGFVYKPTSDTSDCNYQCDICNCNIYMKDKSGNCYIYNASNSDNDTNMDISVNCNSKILPPELNMVYNGQGYVNTDYFKNNSENFKYIDAYLKQANLLKDKYNEIGKQIGYLKAKNASYANIDTNITNIMFSINSFGKKLADYLGVDTSKFISIVPLDFDKIYRGEPNNEVIKKDNQLRKVNRASKKNIDLNANEENSVKKYNSNYLIYSVLAFVMIITILLLIIYKFVPDVISDTTMGVYFAGILAMLLFLHYYLKI